MLINEARCDYVRLTTFDRTQYEKLARVIDNISHPEEPEERKFLQYAGCSYSHAFHGQGEQAGYSHWLVQVSGELAEFGLMSLTELADVNAVKCTRIDLQVTVPLPADWDLRTHVDKLREGTWPWRRRKVEFYENEGPGGTIYVGSRQSSKFARIYIKFSDSDQWPLCLRYEVELKAEIADVIFKTLAVEAVTTGQLLRGEWERLPLIESQSWLAIERALPKDGTPVLLPKELPDENKTIRWLIHKVTPTIKRMLNSHEHGYRTYSWLIDLVHEWERNNNNQ